MNKLLLLAFLVTLMALAVAGTPQEEEDTSLDRTVRDADPKNTCPDGKIRCSNGKCKNKRSQCKAGRKNDGCPSNKITCPNGKCRNKLSQCKASRSGGCPNGKIRCQNGQCKRKRSQCKTRNGGCKAPKKICPSNGKCRKNCNTDRNGGCKAPKKICPNGKFEGKCKKNCRAGRKTNVCPAGKIKCANGKCRKVGKCGSARSGGGAGPDRQSSSSCAVNATCLDNAMAYLKLMKDAVNNFDKQDKRIQGANKTGGKKAGKKGLFAPVLSRIVDAGGGNTSNLTCGGNKNAGADQLKNLSSTLISCEDDIHSACDTSKFPLPNDTKIEPCRTANKAFGKLVKDCMGMNGSDACNCWTNSKFATYATTIRSKDCKISSANNETKIALKACRVVFQKCRKFEDASLIAISACSKSTDELLFKVKSLTENKAALTKVNTTASALAVSSGRAKRAAATSCAEIVTKVTKLNKLTGEDATSLDIKIISGEVTNTTVSITCSAAEKTSLAAQVKALDKSIAFLSNMLEMYLVQLNTQEGKTPSTAEILAATKPGGSAATDMMTTASSRRNQLLAQHLMARLNKN